MNVLNKLLWFIPAVLFSATPAQAVEKKMEKLLADASLCRVHDVALGDAVWSAYNELVKGKKSLSSAPEVYQLSKPIPVMGMQATHIAAYMRGGIGLLVPGDHVDALSKQLKLTTDFSFTAKSLTGAYIETLGPTNKWFARQLPAEKGNPIAVPEILSVRTLTAMPDYTAVSCHPVS